MIKRIKREETKCKVDNQVDKYYCVSATILETPNRLALGTCHFLMEQETFKLM